MEHNLVFTINGLLFGAMLLITIISKKRKNNARTQTYTMLIGLSTAYAITDIITLLLLNAYGPESGLLRAVWNLRSTFIYYFIIAYGWYLYLLFKNSEIEKLSTFIKKKVNIGLIIYISFASFLSIAFGNFPGYTMDSISYTGGRGFISTMAFPLVGIIISFILSLKYRKTRPAVFNTIFLMFIILIIMVIFQMAFPHISLLPFTTIIMNFAIYYNIENPDIELLEQVISLKNKIDKSSNTKTDFLFNLSYDLVNPMNAIVSLSQSLKILSIDNKEEIHRDLKSIKYAGNTLLDSIDNILDLSESDEQDNMINNKEYSVYELLKRMETVAIARIGAKQITFEMNIDDNINSKLSGDITKIQKILLNIINNAAKYTEIGKIKMDVTCTTEKETQVLHFKISDTGNGIKDEIKPFIFTDSQETSGVGLALTKKYVEAMKGTISFESVYGAGTTFNVDIPQKIVGTRLIKEDKEEDVSNETIEFIDCSQYKVLIVDDDVLDIKVTKRLIEKYKFQITTLTSSSECIDRIKAEEEYDILFLDHKMQEIDGMQTMKILKGLEGYKIPKIIALTANAVTGAREYYLKEGFDDYISKPIDTHELDRIIKKSINKKA